MKYKIEELNSVLFITIEGDLLGVSDTIIFLDEINDKINSGKLKAIIDMSGIRYMNSSGIGILITVYTKFKNKGGNAVILNPNDQTLKLLNMTKLDTVIRIFQDVNAAQQAV